MSNQENNKRYRVIRPETIYKGRTYGDLAQDWFNWFLCSDSDNRNLGPVVFLRSKVIPRSATGKSVSETESELPMTSDAHYTGYKNEPNVRIGSDRLQIYSDQALFIPIIVAYAEASKPYDDWGTMQEYTGMTIDNGDNPPKEKQLTIDGDPITVDGKPILFEDHRIVTSVFTAVVPDTAYGRSVKDFLEMPLAPGSYPAIVDGYFVLLRFEEAGTYLIHSYAHAGREILGPYFSQFLYQIEVHERPGIDSKFENGRFRDKSSNPHLGVPGFALARDEKIISEIITEKLKNGELSPDDVQQIGGPLKKIIGFDVVNNYQASVANAGDPPSAGTPSKGTSRSRITSRRKIT